MSTKILCVDDEPHVLAGYERQLRKQFDLVTAVGGPKGLDAIKAHGPFAVIVSDMRMPEMTGVEFLRKVRDCAPNSVRMMLTGNNDQQTAISAVNHGNIFRFLSKPCPAETLACALRAGLEQYRLITAERELLEKTLRCSIKVLTEVLSLVSPLAFGRAVRVQRLVHKIGEVLKVSEAWRLDVAAMLSQIGCVTVPETALERVYGSAATDDDCRMFERHPQIGSTLIANIPRLDGVAECIAYQNKCFDGSGKPADEKKSESIPLGARILKAALDFEALQSHGQAKSKIIECMRARIGCYDPLVLGALDTVCRTESVLIRKTVGIRDLRRGMILDENILNVKGVTLVGKGLEVTDALLHRLQNIASENIREPVAVLIAAQE